MAFLACVRSNDCSVESFTHEFGPLLCDLTKTGHCRHARLRHSTLAYVRESGLILTNEALIGVYGINICNVGVSALRH